MATIPQREKALPKVIDSLYPQVDELRIVFNNYEKIPDWIKSKDKIQPLLNNPDKYTSNAIWLLMDGVDGYIFTCDDDILYPSDYVAVMVKKLQENKNNVVVSIYGEQIKYPAQSYRKSRRGIGFQDRVESNIFVDIAGVGCSAFHTDTIYPTIEHFPDPYTRDLWFAVFVAKAGVKIIRVQSCSKWLGRCECDGPQIKHIWRKDPQLSKRREEIFFQELLPSLRRYKT